MISRLVIDKATNDRLLELAGGCRHWWIVDVPEYGHAHCHKCKCGYDPQYEDLRPAVGDGHQMTLGEMVRLALTKVNCEIIFRADGVSLYDLDEDEEFWQPVKTLDELPAALAAAILAAVDGEAK